MLENFRKLFPGGSGGGQAEQVVSLEHLREILDTIEVKFGQMKTEYATYRETTEAQLAKAADAERVYSRLQQERDALSNQLAESERRAVNAEATGRPNTEETEFLRASLEREMGEKRALIRQMEEQGREIERLQAEQVVEANVGPSEDQLQEWQAERERLAGRARELEVQLSAAQQPLQAAPDNTELQAEREYWEGRSRELEKQLGAVQLERHELVARYEGEVDQLRVAAQSGPPEVQHLVLRLQAERDQLAEELAASRREALVPMGADELQAERDRLAEELGHVQSRAMSQESEFARLQAERDQLIASLDQIRGERDALSAGIDLAHTQRNEIEQRRNADVEDRQALEDIIQRRDMELSHLQRQVQALTEDLEQRPAAAVDTGALESQLDGLRQENAALKERLTQARQMAEQELEREAREEVLEQQVATLRERESDMQRQLEGYRQELESAQQQLAAAQQQAQSVQQQLEAAQQQPAAAPARPRTAPIAGQAEPVETVAPAGAADRRKLLRQIISH